MEDEDEQRARERWALRESIDSAESDANAEYWEGVGIAEWWRNEYTGE